MRGKLFLMFVDDHHGDGRLAVWCKSSPEEQRRLVGDSPARFFVPPYVGVKGWVGVVVSPDVADWIALSILVEHAWTSVAPPRLVRGGVVPAEKPLPSPSPRVTTDPEVARRALERLTKICLALPDATCERDARHATYRVKNGSSAESVGVKRAEVARRSSRSSHRGIVRSVPPASNAPSAGRGKW